MINELYLYVTVFILNCLALKMTWICLSQVLVIF